MEDDVQSQESSNEGGTAAEPAAPAETPKAEAPKSVAAMLEAAKQEQARKDAARLEAATQAAAKQESKPEEKAETARPEGGRGRGQGGGQGQGRREDRPQRGPGGPGTGRGEQRSEARPGGGERREGGRPGGEHRGPGGGERREGGRPGGGARPFEGMGEIELEKLVSDSLYLDNQAHAVVARMRDMDSGTKSQLRRLYNAVRRAVRAPESERQHQFVMLRARLAYTIARHSLRSLDALERLLLQVTRRNDARGYERFKDLFEAIVAYNE